MKKGIIIKGIGGFYYVSDNNTVTECRARGRLRKEGIKPLVGDMVLYSENAVEEILPRKNSFIRPPVANIDRLVIVMATANPLPDFNLINKLIVLSEHKNVEPVIVINKTDLNNADYIIDIYKNTPYKIFQISTLEKTGIDEFSKYIENGITAFAGNSGVGKSSLLNSLGFNLQTGETSKIDRGKHTTRHVELFAYKNGFLMDTPGFSILQIDDIDSDDLEKYFVEFETYSENCLFSGCKHIDAQPSKCGIIKAVEKGEINPVRYETYKTLYKELKENKHWKK